MYINKFNNQQLTHLKLLQQLTYNYSDCWCIFKFKVIKFRRKVQSKCSFCAKIKRGVQESLHFSSKSVQNLAASSVKISDFELKCNHSATIKKHMYFVKSRKQSI